MENNSSEDFKAGDRVCIKGDIRKTGTVESVPQNGGKRGRVVVNWDDNVDGKTRSIINLLYSLCI